MSTILRALKRLETEPSNTDELPSMGRQTSSRFLGGRTRWRIGMLWLMMIILLLSVSAGGFLWYRFPNIAALFDSSSRPAVKDSNTKSNIIVGKIPPAGSKPPSKAVKTESDSKPIPFTRSGPAATPQKRSPMPLTAKTPIKATQPPVPLPAVQTPQKPVPRRPSPEFLAPKPKPSPGPEAKPSPPDLTDSNYTLQAIAWSKDPKARLAVINGQVLREGDGIEGITVTQIGANEVIVQKESKLWKLAFQAR